MSIFEKYGRNVGFSPVFFLKVERIFDKNIKNAKKAFTFKEFMCIIIVQT